MLKKCSQYQNKFKMNKCIIMLQNKTSDFLFRVKIKGTEEWKVFP